MVIDYLFRVVHAAITDLDGVSVEDFSELVIFGKVLSLTPHRETQRTSRKKYAASLIITDYASP